MNVLLIQVDGKLPNIALMRIAAHHKAMGDSVILRGHAKGVVQNITEIPQIVYCSTIFERSREYVESIKNQVIISGAQKFFSGGTGVNRENLEDYGITTKKQDYSLYPDFQQSIGFTQRGCRLRCSFCVVPSKEGAVKEEQTIAELWRGDPHPRHLHLLDNDFFGQPHWRDRIAEIRDGKFKVSFTQGINARFLDDEAAEAIASVDYRDDSMKVKRIYTAWDNLKDEERLFAGLKRLVKYGVKPDHIMVYMLIGYWPEESEADREERRAKLRAFGARPYPMAYERTRELQGFQRWVIGAYDKRISWDRWKEAKYRPENLGRIK